MKRLKHFVLIYVLLGVFTSTHLSSEILVPEMWDYPKYVLSKVGQIFVPEKTIQIIQKVEKVLEQKNPASYAQYLKIKNRFYQFAGYSSWKAATDLPFVGIHDALNIPGIVAFSISQIFWQEYLLDKLHLSQKIDRVLPQAKPTIDIKLSDGSMLSLYLKKGKLAVRESIWNNEQGLVHKIINKEGRQLISFTKSTLHPLSITLPVSSFKKIDESVLAQVVVKGKSFQEIFLNPNGWPTAFSKLNRFTTFVFEDGGKGYTTTASYALEKYLKILIGSNISWPFFEVGRQLWYGGVLNLYPYTVHSIGLYSSFVTGGYFGSAIGSRMIDMAAYPFMKFEARFPNICKKLPAIRVPFKPKPTGNICIDSFRTFTTYVEKPTLITLDTIREYLGRKYGMLYLTGSMAGSIAAGGSMAFLLPRFYHQKESEFLNWFYAEENAKIERIPDESNFGGLNDEAHPLAYFEDEEYSDDEVSISNSNEKLDTLFVNTFNAYAHSSTKTWNDLMSYQTDSSKKPDSTFSLSDGPFSGLFENPSKDMLWLTYLMSAPIQAEIESTITHLDQAQTKSDLEDHFKAYLRRANLINGFNQITSSMNQAPLDLYRNQMIGFVRHSDMILMESKIKEFEGGVK